MPVRKLKLTSVSNISVRRVHDGGGLVIFVQVTMHNCQRFTLLVAIMAVQRRPISLSGAGNPCSGVELQPLLFINI